MRQLSTIESAMQLRASHGGYIAFLSITVVCA